MKTNVALFLVILAAIGFASQAKAQVDSSLWKKMPPEGVATITCMLNPADAAGNRTLLAGTPNGLYRESPAGWQRVMDIPVTEPITVLFELYGGNKILACLGSGDGWYESDTHGQSWTGPFNLSTNFHLAITSVVETDSFYVYMGTDGGIFNYDVTTTPGIASIVTSSIGVISMASLGNIIIAEDNSQNMGGQILWSTDEGHTWAFPAASDDVNVMQLCTDWVPNFINQSTVGNIWGIDGDRLMRTTDGLHWIFASALGGFGYGGSYLCPTESGALYLLGNNGLQQQLLFTTDLGVSWKIDTIPQIGFSSFSRIFNVLNLGVDNSGTGVFLSGQNCYLIGQYYWDSSWYWWNVGLGNARPKKVFADTSEVFAATNSYYTSDPSLNLFRYYGVNSVWSVMLDTFVTGGNSATTVYDVAKMRNVHLIATDYGIKRTPAKNPSSITHWTTPMRNCVVTCFYIDGANIYAATSQGMYLSADVGVTWVRVGKDNNFGFTYLKKMNDGTIYGFSGNSGALFTSNDWSTWTEVSPNSHRVFQYSGGVAIDDQNYFYELASLGGNWSVSGLWRSTDLGVSWTNMIDSINGDAILGNAVKVSQDGTLFVCTSTGVLESPDAGLTWYDMSEGLEGIAVNSISFDEKGFAYIGTDGYGCFKSAAPLVSPQIATPTPSKIQLTAPADGYATTNDSIFFSWAADPAASTYTLEIATDMGFTNIIDNPTGFSGPAMEVIGTIPGKYYWRVRGTNDGGDGPYSDTLQFTVTAASVGTSANVEVIGNLYPNPTSGSFTAQLPADFGKPERIELLDNQGKIVQNLTSEASVDGLNVNCKLPPLPDGAYFFRVESKTQSLIYKVLVKK